MAVRTSPIQPTEQAQREDWAVTSPITGEVVGTVPYQTPDDVAAVISRGREAQQAWVMLPFRKRAAIFKRFHDLMLEKEDRVCEVIQSETGKARRDAFVEIFGVAAEARYYTTHGGRYLKSHRVQPALPIRHRVTVNYHPVGVVGIISPWNFPFLLAVSDAIPALLAGNAVVLKPSEVTPLSAILCRDLLIEAGLPEGLYQVMTGDGPELGEALVDQVDSIMFTGSSRVGKLVAVRAAARLIPFSMELGGKNAMIVLPDADMKKAARIAIEGSFNNCGQVCVNWEKIYISDGMYDSFKAEVVRLMKELRISNDLSYDTDVGSLVNDTHRERVEAHVRDALDKGATVLAGGKRREDLGSAFYEPTLLEGVTPEMDVYANETFGPVAALYAYSSIDEAIRLANDSKYGLNFGVFTRNRREGERVAARLEAGTVAVNDSISVWVAMEGPMGGFKESGFGRRHGGAAGIRKYTEGQTVVTNLTGFQISSYETALGMNKKLTGFLLLLLRVWRHIPGIR